MSQIVRQVAPRLYILGAKPMTLDQLSAAATELLPCPFCGGPAEVESKRCGWRVHCIKPSCYTAGPYPDDCTEAEAITAWNQRTGQLVAVADDAIERVARTLAPNHDNDIIAYKLEPNP
jgi:hypothetical protein